MDAVAAKLMQTLIAEPRRRRIPSPGSDVSLNSEDMLEKHIEWEELAYERLTAAGGRPLYPLKQLRAVAQDPDAFADVLLPFTSRDAKNYKDWWCVYDLQDRSWGGFRSRQRWVRKSESALAAYNEKAAKSRALIGITRPFVFNMDKDKQDKLTTWAEYLEYECGLYEQHGGRMRSFSRQRNVPEVRRINWVLDQIPVVEKEMADEASPMQPLTRPARRRIPSPGSDVSLDSEDMLEKEVQREEDAYDQLLEKGGRALYNIDMLRTVSENPDAYTDLIQSFTGSKQKDDRAWWCVFRLQKRSWEGFQWVQRIKRKTDARLAAHNKLAASNRAMLKITEPFVFVMEKDKQDKLTTWMEYLEYECAIYIQNGNRMEHLLKYGTGSRAGTIKWVIGQIPVIEKEMADEASAPAGVVDTSPEAVGITATGEKPTSSRKRRREDKDDAPGAPIQESTEPGKPAPKRSRVSKPPKAASVQAKSQLAAPISLPAAATRQPAPRRSARLAANAIPSNVDAGIPATKTKPGPRARYG